MIIRSLSASNVLKYGRLELAALPENGLIGISGPNESGKSSIGEAVCFALFGRTFSLGESDVAKIIRWGESQCSAELRFEVADGKQYEIARFLDNEGNHSARLTIAGEQEPIVRGAQGVGDALFRLLGFEFDEFIESFYLAQREITTPHPHSHAIKVMAGIAPLEIAAAEFEQEVEVQEEEIESLEYDINGVQQELGELGIDPDRLTTLEQDRDAERKRVIEQNLKIIGLEEAAAAYQDNEPALSSARRSRVTASLLRLLSFLAALAAGAAWLYLSKTPEAEMPSQLMGFLSAYAPNWGTKLPWLLYASAIAGVLFLLFWARRASLDARIAALQQHGGELAERLAELRSALPASADPAGGTGNEPPPAEVEAEETAVATPLDEKVARNAARPSDEEFAALHSRIVDATASSAEVRSLVAREVGWVRDRLERRQEALVHLEEAIERELERLRKAGNLEQERTGYQEQIEKRRQQIQVRGLAGELLEGGMRQISQRFNRNLRGLVGRTLPLFTENRYEHLQIGDDLNVRVFSSEKRDFMDLDEISSGTQRQIMLAVRLALAQELVDRTVKGPQFMVLDEPFAFFDQERTRSALAVLPKLSDQFSQVWVIAQDFPPGVEFAKTVTCDRDSNTLSA